MAFEYSAVIVTYNAHKTVRRALQSILDQAIRPKEIILVDDYSDDETVSIAINYMKQHNSFTLERMTDNSGQSHCRNLATSLSTCEYVMFFDDDDVSLRDRSSYHNVHFQEGANVSFVSSTKRYLGGMEKVHQNFTAIYRPDPRNLATYLLTGNNQFIRRAYVPSSTCCVSRDSFQAVGGFDTNLRRLEDVDLAVKFALHNFTMAWSEEVGVIRFATTSAKKGDGKDMAYEEMLIERYRGLLKARTYSFAKRHVRTRYLYFSNQRGQLLLHLLRNPVYSLLLLLRPQTAIKRIWHDFRIFKRR